MPIVVLLVHALLPVMIAKPVCAIMDTLEMEKPAKVETFPKIRKLLVKGSFYSDNKLTVN